MISFPRNNSQTLPMCEVMFGCFYMGGKRGRKGTKQVVNARMAEGLGRWGWREAEAGRG